MDANTRKLLERCRDAIDAGESTKGLLKDVNALLAAPDDAGEAQAVAKWDAMQGWLKLNPYFDHSALPDGALVYAAPPSANPLGFDPDIKAVIAQRIAEEE